MCFSRVFVAVLLMHGLAESVAQIAGAHGNVAGSNLQRPPARTCRVAVGGQCGGTGYNGCKYCAQGLSCIQESPLKWWCKDVPMGATSAGVGVAVAEAPCEAGLVQIWQQCGGLNFKGCTRCDAQMNCTFVNDYYSQCLPSGAAGLNQLNAQQTIDTVYQPGNTAGQQAVGANAQSGIAMNPGATSAFPAEPVTGVTTAPVTGITTAPVTGVTQPAGIVTTDPVAINPSQGDIGVTVKLGTTSTPVPGASEINPTDLADAPGLDTTVPTEAEPRQPVGKPAGQAAGNTTAANTKGPVSKNSGAIAGQTGKAGTTTAAMDVIVPANTTAAADHTAAPESREVHNVTAANGTAAKGPKVMSIGDDAKLWGRRRMLRQTVRWTL